MKVVILAGGFGTRISEETDIRPKPMVEIGGKPILWHIMKSYAEYGHTEFIILLGYKGYFIKEYFANYFLHQSDVTFHTAENKMEVHNNESEDWKVTLVDTGLHTMTGGRIARAKRYIGDETFLLTYGDGVSNVNINELTSFHQSHQGALTVTSIKPDGRFGSLDIADDGKVNKFTEKPKGDGQWINGGFFVCNKEVFNYISEDQNCIFEKTPLETLAKDGEIFTYQHNNFWKCMDTLRDKIFLEEQWKSGNAPWKIWN